MSLKKWGVTLLLPIFLFVFGLGSSGIAETLEIQPSTADSLISMSDPVGRYGYYSLLEVRTGNDWWGATERTVLRFDFSSLPENAVISGASLRLYYLKTEYDAAGRVYWVYEVIQGGWLEVWGCWIFYEEWTPWDVEGGDFITTGGASVVVPSGSGWVDWNVLGLVQHFQGVHNKISNFLIKDSDDMGEGLYEGNFYSNDYTIDPSLCPKLLITYTVPSEVYLSKVAGFGGALVGAFFIFLLLWFFL